MIILFSNTKGGVGKSTLAAHLVLFLLDRGSRVALIDADEQGSSSQWIAEAAPSVTVQRVTDPEGAAEAVIKLRSSHDVVICDSPGDDNDVPRTLMLLADLAVFPVGPSILDLRSLARATSLLRYARQINGGRPDGRLVLNKVKKRDRISESLPEAAEQLGVPLLESKVRDLEAFRDAAQQATSVTRMKRGKNHAKYDIEALCVEVLSVAASCIAATEKGVANG